MTDKHRRATPFRDLPRVERDLYYVTMAETALKELRDKYASPRQPYHFIADALGELTRERIILTAMASGDPNARRVRAAR